MMHPGKQALAHVVMRIGGDPPREGSRSRWKAQQGYTFSKLVISFTAIRIAAFHSFWFQWFMTGRRRRRRRRRRKYVRPADVGVVVLRTDEPH